MPERRRKRTNQDRGTDEVKQDRSLLLYVLLSFVTFSVYHFYFMDLWAKDVNILCEKDGKHTVGVEKMMLFSVLTFGVYKYVWLAEIVDRICDNAAEYDVEVRQDSETFFVWMILVPVLGYLVAMYRAIQDTNRLAEAYERSRQKRTEVHDNPNTKPPPPCMRGRLSGLTGSLAGRSFELIPGRSVELGRNPAEVSLIVRGEKISRIHCTVQYNGKDLGFNVTDHSRNGVFVNGVRIPYKKVVHSQRVVAAVSLVLAVSGTLAILFGVQRIGVERYAAYDALVRKGRTAADEMRFDEAEQDLQQAIAIYDDQLEAYVEQAVLLYRQGKYQECIDAVETTQSRELKYYSRQSVANLYNVAAEAYYELESYESAATMYQKAIGYSPDILSYYQGEATALIQLGDYSGADEVLAEMAKAVPDAEQSGAYQVVQSELLRKQGDLPDALDAARKAIGSADGNDQLARAYRLAASICEDIGDSMLSEEINLLNQGIEQLPDGYYNALAGQLASAYIRQAEATGNPGYQKDALRTYQQLEKNGNTTLEVRLNIAMLQYQLHDFSKAMEMLQALKKDYPKDYRVYKWLAFVQGELDLQNGASYTKTLGYYETAAELYRAEQASGVYDPQMDELDRMARNNWQ